MISIEETESKQGDLFPIQQAALARHLVISDARDFKDAQTFKLSQGDKDAYYLARWKLQNDRLKPANGVFAPFHGVPLGYRRVEKRQAAADTPAACEDVGGCGAAALLTPAKSQSRLKHTIDENTGEIQGFSYDDKRQEFVAEFDPVSARLESFALQAAAREILKGLTKDRNGRQVPQYRVCDCLRNGLSGSDGVTILKSALVDSVRFSGLQTCGSVWHCKVCATRVSEVRKLEIRHAVDSHLAAGGGVLFLTNTFPHSRNDDLREMLCKLFDVAWNRYINHRAYKRVRKSFGYVGRVRALEVTWGESNGWHPHVHEIWFVGRPMKASEMKLIKSALFDVWKATALGAGFKAPNRKYGVDVQGAESAADYIAKFGTEPRWEIGKELAKAHTKKSRDRKGKTPFDLVREYAETGSEYAGDLFREYCIAFAGKTQLYWSQGLKDHFRISEISDEQIAAKQESDSVVLASICWSDWRLVLRSQDRGLLLELARNGGSEAVHTFLSSLRACYQEWPAVSSV